MENNITKDTLKYIVARIKANADDVKADKKSDFNDGLGCAYYEVLDILQSEIGKVDDNLKDYGLDIDLEKEYA